MKKSIWDKYAPIYKRIMEKDERYFRHIYEVLEKKVENKTVLEIAAGPGILAKKIAYNTKKIIASDFSQGMIEQAKRGCYSDKLTFEIADATNLKYKNDEFDVVIIANALHIIPNSEKVLSEIERVLNSKGILIAPNFINSDNKKTFWIKALEFLGIKFENYWTEKTYILFLEENGWKILNKQLFKTSRMGLLYVECIRS